MAELKTQVNDANVEDFLNTISDEQKRKDSFEVVKLMKSVTKQKPKMWGPAIIGFDSYSYKYASGHEGTMCLIGFSARASSLTLYIMLSSEKFKGLLKQLGKHKVSGSCLHIKKLEDVDMKVLKEMISEAYKEKKAKHK